MAHELAAKGQVGKNRFWLSCPTQHGAILLFGKNAVMTTDKLAFTTWVEIDLGAIVHNYLQVKALVGEGVKVLGVVKANAYGHGLVEVARVLEERGIDYLGVTRVEEGIELREAGVQAPILVFSPPLPEQIEIALLRRLTLTVDSVQLAEQIAQAQLALVRPSAGTEGGEALQSPSSPNTLFFPSAPVHLKIDTGMGRLGIRPDEVREVVQRIRQLEGITLEGVYTHFARAQEDDPLPTLEQLQRFRGVIELLGEPPRLLHCANSAAAVRFPETHLGMVRIGNLLYGQNPVAYLGGKLDLRNTFEWKARIVALRQLQKGDGVGYGSEWRAPRRCTIATIAVGFADGFGVEVAARTPSLVGHLRRTGRYIAERLGGKEPLRCCQLRHHMLPVVGRIGMQQTTLLVPEGVEAKVGDVVIVPARRLAISSQVRRVFMAAPKESPS